MVGRVSGPDVAHFSLVGLPAPSLSGEPGNATSSFTVRFAPLSAGPKTANLAITSNDPDEGTFNLTLMGKGGTAGEIWRYAYFGQPENSDEAGDETDPDRDGLVNLLERAFNLHPLQGGTPVLSAGTGTAGLPLFTVVGTPETPLLRLEYLRQKASTNPGLVYLPLVTGNLIDPEEWSPFTGTETVTPISETWERVVIEDSAGIGSPMRFGRIQVTASP